MPKRSLWFRWLPAVVVVFVFALFARTLSFGLYLDDNHHARPWTLSEVLGTFNGPFDPLGIEPPYFRPLPVVTFAIDWSLWGFEPWGYHVTNVALHAAAAVLLFFVMRRMVVPELPALLGALYFAAIPANAATAIYVSERSDALVAIFALAAVIAIHGYAVSGRTRWIALATGWSACAMASKEVGAAVVLIVPLFWLYFALNVELGQGAPSGPAPRPANVFDSAGTLARTLGRMVRDGTRWRQLLRICVPLVALAGAYAVHRVRVLPTGLMSAHYGQVGPLRGFASAVLWTFRGVPWEVSAPALLPLVVAVTLLALASRPSPRALAVLATGLLAVLFGCAPLGLLGQVEPRLLYLPEVGHAILMGGVFMTFYEARTRDPSLARKPLASLAGILVSVVLLAVMGGAELRSQNEFRPLGYKMLRGYRRVVDDPKKELYPRHHVEQIERILEYAQQQNLDGAR